MKLYGYFRSSAAFRVRIGLALKGLAPEQISIHLRKGEQAAPGFRAINPQGLVPVLVDGPHVLTQSLAILEYLDETRPEPPFLPRAPADRARVRAIAQAIACDIHPLNNTSPLRYLKNVLKHEQSEIDAWYHHWILEGFEAVEALVRPGPYCFGAQVTLADICIVPQVANARRLKTPLDRFPKILAIDSALQKLPAFEKARPENQPDAE
jgi:maleylpyruvate isomerase